MEVKKKLNTFATRNNKKAKTMKKYFICDIDIYGQRTGEYHNIELPAFCVESRQGCNYCKLPVVHTSGFEAAPGSTFLFSSEIQAQRAALS